MKHLKTYENINDSKLKVGDYVKHISWEYVDGKPKKILSDEIYKISDYYDDEYEISNLQDETIDWVSRGDIVKVPEIEINANKYNI